MGGNWKWGGGGSEEESWLNQTGLFLFLLTFATTASRLPVSTISPPLPGVEDLPGSLLPVARWRPRASSAGVRLRGSWTLPASLRLSSRMPGRSNWKAFSGDSALLLILDFWGVLGWTAETGGVQGPHQCGTFGLTGSRMSCFIEEATFQIRLCLHLFKSHVLFYFITNITLFWGQILEAQERNIRK